MAFRVAHNQDGSWSLWWRGDLYGPLVRNAIGHKWRQLFRFPRRCHRGEGSR